LNDEAKGVNGDRYPTTKLFNLYTAGEIARLPRVQGVVVKYSYFRLISLFSSHTHMLSFSQCGRPGFLHLRAAA
jgi:hypothetical protein